MKKKRVIKLKNPRLRKIRKNLRELLLQVFSEKWGEILDKKKKIMRDPDITYYQKNKRVRKLSGELQDLKLAKSKAPLSCSTCKRIDIDLLYNPILETWFCEECYEFNSQGHKHWYP